jgi:hypothetical protein
VPGDVTYFRYCITPDGSESESKIVAQKTPKTRRAMRKNVEVGSRLNECPLARSLPIFFNI